MRIAEMEEHERLLESIECQIREKQANCDFPATFELCRAALQHVEPAFRLRKKRNKTPVAPALQAFSVLWKYGPPLFEHRILTAVHDIISATSFLARHENNYLGMTKQALAATETARVLWNHLESNPGFWQRKIRADLGLDREQAISIIEIWESLGVVDRIKEASSNRLYLRTHLTRDTSGVCMNCYMRVKGRKERLLQPVKCKKCGVEGYFFLPATVFS